MEFPTLCQQVQILDWETEGILPWNLYVIKMIKYIQNMELQE